MSVQVSVSGISITVPKGFTNLNVSAGAYASFANIKSGHYGYSSIYINYPGNCWKQIYDYSKENFTTSADVVCNI